MSQQVGLSSNIALPPDITLEALLECLEEIRGLVGSENLTIVDSKHVTPDGEGSYMELPKDHDLFFLLDKGSFIPSAVVSPGSPEETANILKVVNKYLVPVWPISRGRNLGYGGPAPRVRGSIILDIGNRMNRVLEVNEDSAYVLVEPGVSYFMLYEHLQKNGFKRVWVDVPDLGGGSVIGNALDHGVGYTPYGEHFSMHCGMEVVLPTGDIIRTGMGALPGNNTWQSFPYGYGPYPDGIFSQSNFGIVTKMGVWLMPDPKGFQAYQFNFPREEDLPQIVEALRPLRLSNHIMHGPSLRCTLMDAAVYGPRKSYTSSKKPLTSEELDSIAEDTGVGRWTIYGALYGPQQARDAQWKAIKEAFMKIPGANYKFPEDVPKQTIPRMIHIRNETLQGIPSAHELTWVQWYAPTCGFIAFSPISPSTGKDAVAQYEFCNRRLQEFGFDYLGQFAVGARQLFHIVNIVYDKTNAEQRARAQRCIETLIEDAAKLGYGEYRTHLALMDQVAATYNWNNDSLMEFHRTIKDALDPNGILAPGKSGIWPARFRGRGFEIFKHQPISVKPQL